MYHVRRLSITAAALALVVFLLWLLPRVLNPTPPTEAERLRDKRWVQSSPYWVDRQACLWLGLCGVHHVRWDPPALPDNHTENEGDDGDLRRLDLRSVYGEDDEAMAWEDARRMDRLHRRGDVVRRKNKANKALKDIPDYVLKYAPLVHLYSGENFWPSDIAEHVKHMHPFENGTALNLSAPVTLDNLAKLNKQPFPVYLTSEDDIESRPEWLHSHMGIPFAAGDDGEDDRDHSSFAPEDDGALRTGERSTWYDVDKEHPIHGISDPRRFSNNRRPTFSSSDSRSARQGRPTHPGLLPRALGGHKPDQDGYSAAPAVLVLVEKGSNIVDAFWFFFYSYNLGQTVLDIRFGNHVGDWEHCMIRFESGAPRAMFLSEHAGGKAFAWQALEKRRLTTGVVEGGIPLERPVIYSAVGSHAMYATSGLHPYVLPFKMLADATDHGPLWDPALHNLAYWYDYEADGDVEPEAVEPAEAAAALQANLFANGSSTPPADWTRFFAASFDQGAPAVPVEDVVLASGVNAQESETVDITDGNSDSDTQLSSLTPAASNPDAPTSWFHFAGPWGDALYPLSDPRQWRLFGQYHYHTGPLGPRFKNLRRHRMCQTERCRILWSLEEEKTARWYS